MGQKAAPYNLCFHSYFIPIYTTGEMNHKGHQVSMRGLTAERQGGGERVTSFPPLLHILAVSASIPVTLATFNTIPAID
jgi:galactose mutarotase-like enzyme